MYREVEVVHIILMYLKGEVGHTNKMYQKG